MMRLPKLKRPALSALRAAARGSAQSAGFRRGSYSAGLTALVLAIVVVANLIVGELPSSVRTVDLTSGRLFDLGEQTQTVMDALDADVTLTLVTQPDSLDPRIDKLVQEYAGLSGHVTVETVDPVLHPAQAQALSASDGTLVVACEATGETRQIAFDDIITHTYSMYSYSPVEDSFDGEGQLTAAILAVTQPSDYVVYTTEGHGESALGTSVQEAIEKANLQTGTVNLIVDGGVPEDCALLVVNAPQKDLDTTETAALADYIAGGGEVIVLLGQSETEQPNLRALLAQYGMTVQDGYVADTERYYSSAYDIFPQIAAASEITSGMTDDTLTLIYNAVGLNLTDPTADGVTTETLLQTSTSGHLVTLAGEDTPGQFVLGARAVQTVADAEGTDEAAADTADTDAAADTAESEAETGSLCVLPATLLDESILGRFSNLSNLELFVNAVTTPLDDVARVAIPAKSLTDDYNYVQNAGLWGAIFIGVIPLGVLAAGFVHWMYRRRRSA